MNFIEELYYGNINPNEKRYDKDNHYAKTIRKFCDSENELGKMLKGKPLHLVNDLINASDEIVAITSIYQSVKPDFNPDVEYMKDPLSRDIPSVDNSLFILARKLILNSTSNGI